MIHMLRKCYKGGKGVSSKVGRGDDQGKVFSHPIPIPSPRKPIKTMVTTVTSSTVVT